MQYFQQENSLKSKSSREFTVSGWSSKENTWKIYFALKGLCIIKKHFFKFLTICPKILQRDTDCIKESFQTEIFDEHLITIIFVSVDFSRRK